MTTISEARTQVQQAKQRAKEQRQQISEAREKAKRDKQTLTKQEKELPRANQQRLRQGLYAGLEGRKRRRAVSNIKEQLKGRKQLVSQFEKGLTEYEKKELAPFESQIKSKEAEIKRVEDYNQAVKSVQRAVDKDMVWAIAAYGSGLRQKLAKEYLKLESLQRENFLKQQQEAPEIQLSNVGIKGIALPENKGALGIIKDRAGNIRSFFKSIGPSIQQDNYGSGLNVKDTRVFTVGDVKKVTGDSATISGGIIESPKSPPPIRIDNLGSSRGLSRLNLRDFNKLKNINTDTSSFKVGKDIKGDSFLTTGSPIRRTKLTSLKSRGYQPYLKQKQSPIKQKKPIKSKSLLPSKKDKDYDDIFFTNKKSKKKGRKKSIWGF